MFDEAIQKYSLALYEVALEQDDFMLPEIDVVRSAYENETLKHALAHPKIDQAQKHAVIEGIFTEDLPEVLKNFLFVASDNNRNHLVVDILNAYEDLYYEASQIERILVVTPIALSEEKLTAIGNAYKKSSGTVVKVKQKIDASLIGGIKLVTDAGVIDHSIQRQLNDLSRALRQNA